MIIAMAQINTVIGDFQGNVDRILDYAHRAVEKGAELVVFPEMCLCGYPPLDLLDYEPFVDENLKQIRRVQHDSPKGIGIVLGHIEKNRAHSGKSLLNVASLIHNGKVLHTQAKTLLPTYDVFDEARYFEPARERSVVTFKGERLGIAICEDFWWESAPVSGTRYPIDPVKDLLDLGASLILAPSASPFYTGKPQIRYSLLDQIGKSSGVPVVYVNMVGGNDSLIFDGRSMVTSPDGRLVALGKAFEEDLIVFDTGRQDRKTVRLAEDRYGEIASALILGLKDYLAKCGFTRVHLGLSVGIDSALVATLAVKALGPENVAVFSLPSRYSSKGSYEDAGELARRLGVTLKTLSIEEIFGAFLGALESHFEGREPDITEENLQARIRGSLLMAYSNKFNSLLLATGNKSELATGYCTLYGDMDGGLAVIGDLFKTEVYSLARHMNREREIIPETILDKAPSAELRPDQKDQDSLPPYDLLDQILGLYLLENLTLGEIVSRGYDRDLVAQVLRMVGRAEYKRRQAPPVLKVSRRAFGTGRRMPIARRIFEA
ncbi:MAG TPA: NAD+ synthase [Spirochaetia bacterium]|nr:NAD+ synthase [Spirochaetia bacterium]